MTSPPPYPALLTRHYALHRLNQRVPPVFSPHAQAKRAQALDKWLQGIEECFGIELNKAQCHALVQDFLGRKMVYRPAKLRALYDMRKADTLKMMMEAIHRGYPQLCPHPDQVFVLPRKADMFYQKRFRL